MKMKFQFLSQVLSAEHPIYCYYYDFFGWTAIFSFVSVVAFCWRSFLYADLGWTMLSSYHAWSSARSLMVDDQHHPIDDLKFEINLPQMHECWGRCACRRSPEISHLRAEISSGPGPQDRHRRVDLWRECMSVQPAMSSSSASLSQSLQMGYPLWHLPHSWAQGDTQMGRQW